MLPQHAAGCAWPEASFPWRSLARASRSNTRTEFTAVLGRSATVASLQMPFITETISLARGRSWRKASPFAEENTRSTSPRAARVREIDAEGIFVVQNKVASAFPDGLKRKTARCAKSIQNNILAAINQLSGAINALAAGETIYRIDQLGQRRIDLGQLISHSKGRK